MRRAFNADKKIFHLEVPDGYYIGDDAAHIRQAVPELRDIITSAEKVTGAKGMEINVLYRAAVAQVSAVHAKHAKRAALTAHSPQGAALQSLVCTLDHRKKLWHAVHAWLGSCVLCCLTVQRD